ncbi:hypothetical protein QN277_016090 [Acacia crassicarpa]|uniref:Uncharacterized protein n=1 Tax=Acacia crassicarpa TaxID=499986 RepID=A0AAE1MVX2_9FABA|nr:hypothetical protein QN277_016090 [Acacia crassicarpa]
MTEAACERSHTLSHGLTALKKSNVRICSPILRLPFHLTISNKQQNIPFLLSFFDLHLPNLLSDLCLPPLLQIAFRGR